MATAPTIRATVTVLQSPPTNAPSGFVPKVSFHGWQGWIPSMQAVIDRYVRQGATGSGAMQTGVLGDPVRISAWRIEDVLTTALSNIASWEAFEGLVCSVLDPWSRTLPRVRLTGCSAGPPRIGKGPLAESGAQGIYLVTYSATAERLPDSSS